YQQAAEGKQPRRVVGFIRTDDGIQGRIDGDWIGDRIENAYIYLSQSGEKDKKVRLDCQATYSGVFTLKYKEGIFEGQAWPLQGSEECQNSHFSIRSDKR